MPVKEPLKTLINDFAEAFRQAFDIPNPCTTADLKKAVKDMGGETRYAYTGQLNLEDIRKTGEDSFIILLDPKLEGNDKESFHLARAIGKLFLTMGFMTDEETWKTQETKKI